MARVLLIHPGLLAKDGSFYTIMPMGLISIGDKLEKDGHQVRILNLGLEKKLNKNFSLEKYLEKFCPDFVGVDMHWYPYIYDSIEVARISKNYGANVILGGLCASIFAKDIIENFPFVDGVIIGEGEIPFSLLLKNWKNKEEVPNLAFRKDQKVVLPSIYVNSSELIDTFDFCNFDLIENKEQYIKSSISTGNYIIVNSRYIPNKLCFLFIGRGCSRMCPYCSTNSYNFSRLGIKKPIFRSVKRVVKDIMKLQSIGADMLYINFDPKPFSGEFYDSLFEELKQVRHKIQAGVSFASWSGSIPREKTIEDISRIFPPEMSVVELNVMSAVERVRRENKIGPFSNQDLLDAVNLLKKKRIHACIYFSLGLPFERTEDVRSTINFAKSIEGSGTSVSTYPPSITPASPMCLFPERYKTKVFRRTFHDFFKYSIDLKMGNYPEHPIGYETDLLSEKDIMQLELEGYSKIYMNLRYLIQRAKFTKRSSDNFVPKIRVFLSIALKDYKELWKFKKT